MFCELNQLFVSYILIILNLTLKKDISFIDYEDGRYGAEYDLSS